MSNPNLPYSEAGQGYRRRLPGIRSNKAGGFSKMVKLDTDMTVTRDSTVFVGRDKTTNDLVMVDGDNTGDLVLGFLATGKFESHLTPGAFPIDYDDFNLKAGDEYPLWNNPGMEFSIMIEGATPAERDAAAAACKYGSLYSVFIDTDGTQKLRSSVAGTQFMFLADLGGGFVSVSIAAGAAAV